MTLRRASKPAPGPHGYATTPASRTSTNRTARGLDRTLFIKPAACDFIRERRNMLITGSCGVGKSWLARALGHTACREDFSFLYSRHATAVRGPCARPRRRPLCQASARSCPCRSSHFRGLMAVAAQCQAAPQAPGNRRGPLRRPFDPDHQPITDRALLRDHRRSDTRRRHPGPYHSQRLQDRAHRRQHAQAQGHRAHRIRGRIVCQASPEKCKRVRIPDNQSAPQMIAAHPGRSTGTSPMCAPRQPRGQHGSPPVDYRDGLPPRSMQDPRHRYALDPNQNRKHHPLNLRGHRQVADVRSEPWPASSGTVVGFVGIRI